MSWVLRVYLTAAQVAGPFWRFAVARRVKLGKEDAARSPERFGHASVVRPDGPVLWVHALGIGEASAMLAVIRAFLVARPDASVVLTTNTKTGADGLAKMGLPSGVIHQYAPVDAPAPVTRFLAHWRPDVAVVAELDLWPLMLTHLKARHVPVVMLNARLTDHRFAGRQKIAGLYGAVLRLFAAILVQDAQTKDRMQALGANPDRVIMAGLLKAAAAPLPAKAGDHKLFLQALAGRPVWLAAATDAREVDRVLAAHQVVRAQLPDAVLILAPRQPTEADAAEAMAVTRFGAPSRRSRGEMPKDEAVFLADSMGEMGLWYRLAPLSFVGHSLPVTEGRPLTGKNPFEAVALGSVVIHGPMTGNFAESYEALDNAGCSDLVQDSDDLAAAVLRLLQDPVARLCKAEVGLSVLAQGQKALDASLDAILGRFPPPSS